MDEALRHFHTIMDSVRLTGRVTAQPRVLLRLVADTSVTKTDIITKLGLLGRDQIAWK